MADQQPDFGDISEQLAAIQRTLHEMNGRLNLIGGGLVKIDERLDLIEDKLDLVETRQLASTANTVARGLNSAVQHLDRPLHPLRNLKTGQAIPEFPKRLEKIDSMSGPALGNVLRALEQPTNGTLAEKKRRLKVAIGVVMQAV
ncbi:hypothetical protein MAPG_11892 [Magnaporthiopsis poae ATCC 64411]|uniref:Uncharacterized protein n=1 Tax=Magnaporthiopsis poae (strain ATCC 64411 / 73-15) TaxID=644358 RepID=A0A0C4EGF3_MAGP6|nr:hypothetical protein MAPG_11892 [Magnaporthiopsis poae ATCC 64411]